MRKKKNKKALQIIYFNLQLTKQLFQKHYSFIKVCRLLFIQDIKKYDVLTGILLIVFLRANTFCIGFKFMIACRYHVTYKFQSESTLYSLPECQGTSCSKQAPYLKSKSQQRDSNPQPLSS